MVRTDSLEEISVNFIKDEPSEEDFFGSHSRVSNAVAEVIAEPNSINSIGLLGRWGSGKSTVVKQIENQLAATHEGIHFFNYDAWLNQNDPPRRSFLEALIQDLVENSLASDDQWNNRLADLSGRSEETTTETSRKLSLTGKWILGSLALVPIGTVILGGGLAPENISSQQWMMWIGGILTLAPIIIAVLFYIGWRPWRLSWTLGVFEKVFWTRHRAPYDGQSIFALLTNQSTERTEKTTKISPEPSAAEFRAVFRDILKNLRAKREQLVIVVDNLDRLPEPEAMELWATIRSLFVGRELYGPGLVNLVRPTIILPIDEGSVKRMFGSINGHDASELARSFMDKTFDVAFHINDPVMSDWRAFFREKLEEAFGVAATEDRIYWATKFFEEHITSDSSTGKITPRSLVKIVNGVGVLVKQWSDNSVDFLSLVMFALHRQAINASPGKFVGTHRPSADAAIKDWERDIVALHYGVPREKAFQTLLQEPLRLAISSSNTDEFANLSTVTGFEPVCEEVIATPPSASNSTGPNPDFVLNAAVLIEPYASEGILWAKRSMHLLASTWADCGQLDGFRNDLSIAIKAMAPFDNSERLVSASAHQLGASLPESRVEEDDEASFVEALKAIREAAEARNMSIPTVQLTLEHKGVLSLIERVPSNLRPMLKSDKSAAELLSALSTALEKENESRIVAPATRALASSQTIQFKDKKLPNWDGLAGTAFNTISGNAISFHATGPSIDVLGILHNKNANAKSYVQQLFDQGHLANRLNEADDDKDGAKLADIAALMFLRETDFAAPNGKTWEQTCTEDKEFISNFDNALLWYKRGGRVTYAHRTLKTRPSLEPIVREIVKISILSNKGEGLTTSHMLENVVSLEELIGEDLVTKGLAILAGRSDFWSSVESLSNGPSYENAVVKLANVESLDQKRLLEDVKGRLSSQDADSWDKGISDGSFPYSLAEIYGKTFGKAAQFGDEVKTALRSRSSQLPTYDSTLQERWFFLTRFISKGTRVTLFKNLRDTVHSGAEFADLKSLFQNGGRGLLDEGKFEEFGDKTTRHVTIPLIRDERGLFLLAELSEPFSTFLKLSDDDTKSAVLEALDTIGEELVEEEQQAYKRVRLAFEQYLPAPKPIKKQDSKEQSL